MQKGTTTMKYVCLIGSLFLLLTGCDGSDSNNIAPVSEAFFVDAGLVRGVPYECGSITGLTSNIGAFNYEEGEGCEFLLGTLTLDVSSGDLKDGAVTPYDLTDTKEKAWALSAIIQSVSSRIAPSLLLFSPYAVRVKSVNLSQGKDAVIEALLDIKYLIPQTITNARDDLAKYVDESSEGVISLEQLKQDAIILGDSTSNDVYVYLQDRNQNMLQSYYTANATEPDGWEATQPWYVSSTTPDDPPKASWDEKLAKLTITFDTDRTLSTTMGGDFLNWAMGTANPQEKGPWRSHALGLNLGSDLDQTKNTYFPSELHFAFIMDLLVTSSIPTALPSIKCKRVIWGQGYETKLNGWDLAEGGVDIGEAGFDITDGKWFGALKDLGEGIKKLFEFDEKKDNWYMSQSGEGMGNDNVVYKGTVKQAGTGGDPDPEAAVLLQCTYDQDKQLGAKLFAAFSGTKVPEGLNDTFVISFEVGPFE